MREASGEGVSVWARLALRWRSRRLVVVDDSMVPTLRPGDRLRLDPRAYRRRSPRVGEIVVIADPEHRVPRLVKRIAAIDAATGALEVRSDAPSGGRDSRRFGPVAPGTVVGRVYRIYYPVDRAREL